MNTRGMIALGSLLLSGAAQAQLQPEILREAVGDRAAEMVEMELMPFDDTLWSSLTGWTNGDPLDASATEGNVVLIATWSSWNPGAARVLPMLQTLKKNHEDDGLIIVGVHHPRGWDKADSVLAQRRSDILIAHDADGEFREAIKSDQDPDFYVIDRAGQVRFADIRTEATPQAVKLLLAEETGAAASVAERLEAEAAERDAALRQPKLIQNATALPEVPFLAPGESAYALADWPKKEEDDNTRGRNRNSGPSSLSVPDSGWIGSGQPKSSGRVIVMYAWRLDDPRSVEIAREMDLLQSRLGRDVVVVGVCTGVQGESTRGRNEPQISAEQLVVRVQRFKRSYGIKHGLLADANGSMFNASGSRSRDEDYMAYVASTDGTIRWDGVVADPGFMASLDQVVDVDPGVRARQAAEQAYLRSGE